ncbi:hypothetical protein BDZ91DRAFT_728052 [Kalaharituber pfeilii]|nr:hypothetical protein BDZ91DRAFT_728052 [Kalaharituber pfeilii]
MIGGHGVAVGRWLGFLIRLMFGSFFFLPHSITLRNLILAYWSFSFFSFATPRNLQYLIFSRQIYPQHPQIGTPRGSSYHGTLPDPDHLRISRSVFHCMLALWEWEGGEALEYD